MGSRPVASRPTALSPNRFGEGPDVRPARGGLGVLYFVQQRMVGIARSGVAVGVADAAEADAVPAGGVRRVPGLLPHRSGRSTTWRRPCSASASTSTSPAASTAATSRSVVSRAARRRGSPRDREEGRRWRRHVRPGQARTGCRQAGSEAGADQHRSASGVTPPKNKPTPSAGRAAARPASTGKARTARRLQPLSQEEVAGQTVWNG